MGLLGAPLLSWKNRGDVSQRSRLSCPAGRLDGHMPGSLLVDGHAGFSLEWQAPGWGLEPMAAERGNPTPLSPFKGRS